MYIVEWLLLVEFFLEFRKMVMFLVMLRWWPGVLLEVVYQQKNVQKYTQRDTPPAVFFQQKPVKNDGWKTRFLSFWDGIFFAIYIALPTKTAPWAVLWPPFWNAKGLLVFLRALTPPFCKKKHRKNLRFPRAFKVPPVPPVRPVLWDIRISLASNQGTVFLEPC